MAHELAQDTDWRGSGPSGVLRSERGGRSIEHEPAIGDAGDPRSGSDLAGLGTGTPNRSAPYTNGP